MSSILIFNGSPKDKGNTDILIEWFIEGSKNADNTIEEIQISKLNSKVNGCASCRVCQNSREYGCVIKDDVSDAVKKMANADVIVFATPLYFFSMSAQMKIIIDRMFSLYKWDNDSGTMKTCLKAKKMILLASAFEDIGLDVLEAPFKLTAEYTGMPFSSVLAANAGTSGEIINRDDVREKVICLGKSLC
ncbi:MAG: flavodoxin family protein [Candidatus Omnitrophota bacterium]